jgi:hypothetical protein
MFRFSEIEFFSDRRTDRGKQVAEALNFVHLAFF